MESENLRSLERARVLHESRYPAITPAKLRWRALTVRHCFHVLPGESILELGAGNGAWTEHLASATRGENPITGAIFNDDFLHTASQRSVPNARFVHVHDPHRDLQHESFDYVVGNFLLADERYPETLRVIHDLLKPGGQMLLFESNPWNPAVALKSCIHRHLPPNGLHLMQTASQQGFTHLELMPYDMIPASTPRKLAGLIKSLAFLFEHTPGVRKFSRACYLWARRPGPLTRPPVNLAQHTELRGSTSVVIPSHNEEMNIGPLVTALLQAYGPYLHEILIVNDNSTDRTAEVAQELASVEPRIKLLNRKPPGGVGFALRDGFAAATGRYILTMDCDFVQIVPELRDLFDKIAAGYDGAIGSRFSHQSVLINYPFFKILCNRVFHGLMRLFVLGHIRDISNNLKLYRADILKNIKLERSRFAANLETGLKPMLAGYKIAEVPISWINRSQGMGTSSFRLLEAGPDYLAALVRSAWSGRR